MYDNDALLRLAGVFYEDNVNAGFCPNVPSVVGGILKIAGINSGTVYIDLTNPHIDSINFTKPLHKWLHSQTRGRHYFSQVTVYVAGSSINECHLTTIEHIMLTSEIRRYTIMVQGESAAQSALRSRLFMLPKDTTINEHDIVMNDVSVEMMAQLTNSSIGGLKPDMVRNVTVAIMKARDNAGVQFHRVMANTPTKHLLNLKMLTLTCEFTPAASVIDQQQYLNMVDQILSCSPSLVDLIIVSKNSQIHEWPIAFCVQTLKQLWKRILDTDETQRFKFNIHVSVECEPQAVVNRLIEQGIANGGNTNNMPDDTIAITWGISMDRVLHMTMNCVRK